MSSQRKSCTAATPQVDCLRTYDLLTLTQQELEAPLLVCPAAGILSCCPVFKAVSDTAGACTAKLQQGTACLCSSSSNSRR